MMKRKIICLLMAALCVVSMLAACGKEEAVVCEGHVDADANQSCDNCGTPMHTVINKVPTEEEIVNAVVSAIPSATITTIYNCTAEKTAAMGTAAKLDYASGVAENVGGNTYVVEYEYASTDVDEFSNAIIRDGVKVFNTAKNNAAILTFEDTEYVSYDVSLVAHTEPDFTALIKVVKTNKDYDTWFTLNVVSTETTFYTLDGTVVATIKTDLVNNLFATPVTYSVDADMNGSIVYVNINDTKYAVDMDTNKVVYSAEQNSFVKRPAFTQVSADEKYAYIVDKNKIFVYDNAKWIECVYNYEISATYVDFDYFVLANGNILVQGIVSLPDSVKNYDYADGGKKYNVDYTLVNVAGKTAAPVEFGYIISKVENNVDGVYATAVKNIITAKTITNKAIDKELILCTDDALAILGEVNAVLPNAQIVSFDLVATNRFLAYVVYGEGSSVYQLYDEKGTLIKTLPNNAVINESYIKVGADLYDFDMKPLEALTDAYTIVGAFDNYVLATNVDGDVFYYVPSLKSPALVADAANDATATTAAVTKMFDNCFVVSRTTVVAGVPTTTYAAYNASNTLVANLTADVVNMSVNNDIYTLYLADGSIYIAK